MDLRRRWETWRKICLTWAKSHKFKDRVEETLTRIQSWSKQWSPMGVSLSGGKDSLVALDLARRVDRNVIGYFVDSGAEIPETYQVLIDLALQGYNVEIVQPERNIVDLWKEYGTLGNMDNADNWPDKGLGPEQVKKIILIDPLKKVVEDRGIQSMIVGLRAEESKGRSWLLAHGIFERFHDYEKVWLLYPLLRWTARDIWAYIFSRALPYNKAYEFALDPPELSRIGTIIGTTSIHLGRYARLRKEHPESFFYWTKIFPNMRWFV